MIEVRPVVQPVDDFVTIKVYALISGLTAEQALNTASRLTAVIRCHVA